MKNKSIRLAIFFIFLLLYTGCKTMVLPFKVESKEPKIPENNIKKDIPRYQTNNEVFVFYKYAKQKQKQLGLSIPENGYDSLLLRVWFSYPIGINQFGELVEIRINSKKQIEIKYFQLDIFYNYSREYEVIRSSKKTKINKPQENFDNLLDSTINLGILELKSIDFIPQYKDLTINGGGYENGKMTVSVEISTNKNYRFYQYNGFEEFKAIKEVDKMYRYIKILRENLEMVDINENWY